jgi:hypothetical protein
MRASKINNIISKMSKNIRGKDFKNDMKSIVSKGTGTGTKHF